MVLNAAYEATLCAALLKMQGRGSAKVFLTQLGGGAFGNPQTWIFDGMLSAFEKFTTTDIEITIISYGQEDTQLNEMLASTGFL